VGAQHNRIAIWISIKIGSRRRAGFRHQRNQFLVCCNRCRVVGIVVANVIEQHVACDSRSPIEHNAQQHNERTWRLFDDRERALSLEFGLIECARLLGQHQRHFDEQEVAPIAHGQVRLDRVVRNRVVVRQALRTVDGAARVTVLRVPYQTTRRDEISFQTLALLLLFFSLQHTYRLLRAEQTEVLSAAVARARGAERLVAIRSQIADRRRSKTNRTKQQQQQQQQASKSGEKQKVVHDLKTNNAPPSSDKYLHT
jgi:hypothetical protein